MHAPMPSAKKGILSIRGAVWLCAFTMACAIALSAHAAASSGSSGYHHTAWSLQDGAPADIWAITQSADGYLWLGTGFGLYRFDGVRFERFEPRDGGRLLSGNITAVTVLPSGDLWIGYYHGGFTRIRDGHATHYGTGAGAPSGMVYRIVQDRAGDLWAAVEGGLFRFRDGRWTDARLSAGYPHATAHWVELDAQGALWIATAESVVVRPAGGERFLDTGIAVSPQAILAESPDGAIWVSDAGRGTRPLRRLPDGGFRDATDEFPILAQIHAARLVFLADGSLWGTWRGRGAFRIALPGTGTRMGGANETTVVQSFSQSNGLTADTAVPLFEDREGNLWLGTILGLNRFRYRNVVSPPQPLAQPGEYDQAIRADDGSILIASSAGALMAIDRAAMQRLLDGGGLQDEVARTRANAWWLREGLELWRFEGGVASRIQFPVQAQDGTVDAMSLDHGRRLWISVRDKGVFLRSGGTWEPREDIPSPAPSVIAAGLDGRLWFGYNDGRVAVLDGHRVDIHMPDTGLAVGPVTALHAGRRHVIVAGEQGIARLDDGAFLTLSDGAFSGVTGILESDEDQLWLNGSRGVVRVDGRTLIDALRSPGRIPAHVLFDQSDGLPGVALQAKPTPSAANADGLYWFSTNGGVALIDPERIRINKRPPDVHVLSLSTGSASLSPGQALALPPRTSNLQIAYTATSLSAPERVRFRYRLDGVDDDWRDAGTRREAFYTNLDPGEYTFRVIAANNDGIWNEEGATFAFRIRPTFFQSPWFALSCLLIAVAALYVAYLLHMRQVALHMRARLEERHLERERIARELHDTLLQSVQGLILRLHALAARLDQHSPVRQGMESVMDRAEAVLTEGRDRVRGLRASARETDDLPSALAAIGEEFGQQSSSLLEVAVEGGPKRLRPLVRDELYRIGREAIVNAMQHAHASRIAVVVDYAVEAVQLMVDDDGIGIEPAIFERGDRPGHWGLAGMRERMEWIGGILQVRSSPGAGTSIRATIPASLAYAGEDVRWRGWAARFLRRKP